MPRVLLLLDALLRVTPPDHPDKEAIPTVTSILTSALKGSQVSCLLHAQESS